MFEPGSTRPAVSDTGPQASGHADALLLIAPDGRFLGANAAARPWLDAAPEGRPVGVAAAGLLAAAGLAADAVSAALADARPDTGPRTLPGGATLSPVRAGSAVCAWALHLPLPVDPQETGGLPPGLDPAILWTLFDSLCDHTGDAFGVWELDPPKCLHMNDHYDALFGQPRAMLADRPDAFFDVTHPEDLPRLAGLREALDAGYLDLEFRVVAQDGGTRWLWARMVVQSGGADAPRLAFGLVRDISPRKALEEALRLGEERLLLAVEGAGAGVWDWRTEEARTYYSPNLLAMLGLPPDEVRPPRALMEALLSHDEFDRAYGAIRGALIRGESYSVEMRISVTGLGLRWFRVRGRSRLGPDGAPSRVSGSVVDITEDKRALRVLEQSERVYRQLFEQNPQCMWVYEQASLRILAVNERSVRHYGYPRTEFLSMRIMDLHPPELRAEAEASARHPRDTVWRAGVWRQLTRDGREILVDITTHDTLFEGRPARLVLAEDVTARIAAESALKQSEDRLRRALIDAPIPAALLAEDGEFILVNRVWRGLTGYGPEDFTNLSAWCRLAYGDRGPEIEARVLARFTTDSDPHEGEFALRARGGETLIWDFNSDVVGRLPDGRRLGVVMAMDVTDRRAAMNRLAESERRFRIVAQSTNDAVWELDVRTRLIWWSDSFYDSFGFTREPGSETLDFWSAHVHPDDHDRVVASLQRAMDTGAPSWGEEYRFFKGSGEEAIVVDRGFMLYDGEGRPATMLGGMADVTARRRVEEEIRALNAALEERVRERTRELEAANKELEAFSYSVSHDLRAPLRAIDGFSRILLEDLEEAGLPDDARRHLAVIRSSTQQMGQLIDDLLAFSRLSRQALTVEPVDMERLVGACVRQLTDDLAGRSVDIALDPLPPCMGDARLLRQVWTNLLANAFKYTRDRGRPRVEIGARPDGESQGQVVYHVRDNGVGFDMAYADKLFGVFQRLHRAEEYEGTGVGLAIVQRIVHRHGGRVWAEASPGAGAAFFFSLPAAGDGES